MIHVTMFSGYEGELRPDKYFYVTLFGGAELRRPTIARQILLRRGRQESDRPRRRPFVLTMFGGTSIKSPTLAAEFLDMRELIGNGLFSVEDWDRAMSELGSVGDDVASLTLFGALEETSLPTDEEEIDALAIQCHLGNISQPAREILQTGIGQHAAERKAILRRAIMETV